MDKIDLRIKALELACYVDEIGNSNDILKRTYDFYGFLSEDVDNTIEKFYRKIGYKPIEKLILQEVSCKQILDELQKRAIRK